MNISVVQPLSDLFQTIGSAARLQILLAIGETNPCVCHLEASFGWRQAYLSQHLMALKQAGILIANREGRNIHYRLNDPRLLDLIRQAAILQGVCLPEFTPSADCECPYCAKKRDDHPD
jgi:DNA-binding transcriptional ArsR family regulator